jgi:hypothetical protein
MENGVVTNAKKVTVDMDQQVEYREVNKKSADKLLESHQEDPSNKHLEDGCLLGCSAM